jgi:hypothetical protein
MKWAYVYNKDKPEYAMSTLIDALMLIGSLMGFGGAVWAEWK